MKVTEPFFVAQAKLHVSWACSLYYELQRSISMRSPFYLARKKLRIDLFFPAGFIDQQVMRLGWDTPQPVHPDGRHRRELAWVLDLLVGGNFYNLELERLGFLEAAAPGTNGTQPTVLAKSPRYPWTPELEEAVTHFEDKYWEQPKEQLVGVQSTIADYLSDLDTKRELTEAHQRLERLRKRNVSSLSDPAQSLHREGSAEKESFEKELYLILNLIRFLNNVQKEKLNP